MLKYEAGMYLDKYFVQKDIRFITPGDTMDSAQGAYSLTVPSEDGVLSSAINTSLFLGIKNEPQPFGLAHT